MKTSLVYGGKCTGLLANYDQELQSWRMLQMSFQWADPMLLDRLPQSGMTVNGQLYGLQILEHHTEEPAGLVLPTPTASDPIKHGTGGLHSSLCRREKYSKGDHRRKMLPTPTASDYKRIKPSLSDFKAKERGFGQTLPSAAMLMEMTQEEIIGNNFRLNPQFVEEMMGFPIGWTELEP